MWRLRKNNPNTKTPTWKELKRAIMHEIGTDPRTYLLNKRALFTLGWISKYNSIRLRLTGEDL